MIRSSKSPARRVRPPRRPLLRTAAATALTVLAAGIGLVGPGSTDAQAATLVAVPSFGSNPANLTMYTYVPDNRATRPKILVLVHGCALDAPSYFGAYGRDFRTAADRYGFVIVMPDNRRQGNCFDVATPNGLRRDGGSDSTSIASMVRYAQGLHGVGRADTVIAGSSSGAMTTNVMAAEYPDLFAAGAAYMGVPASCFATNSATNLWNSACANGQVRKTAAQWADAARAMHPGYTGTYPRMQLLHGTADSILLHPNLAEEIKQWTALHSLSQTPVLQDTPQASWTRTRYGSTGAQASVEAISVAGAGHDFPRTGMVAGTVTFLGLDQPASGSQPTPAPTPTPTTTPTGSTGVVDPTRWYVLTNRSTGKAADDYQRSTAEGAPVVQWPVDNGTAQQWRFVPVTGGYYTVRSRRSGRVLEVAGGSTADGARIVQTADAGRTSQQWQVTADAAGVVHLVNRATGKALETGYQVSTDGSPVDQYPYWGGANQQWTLTSVGTV